MCKKYAWGQYHTQCTKRAYIWKHFISFFSSCVLAKLFHFFFLWFGIIFDGVYIDVKSVESLNRNDNRYDCLLRFPTFMGYNHKIHKAHDSKWHHTATGTMSYEHQAKETYIWQNIHWCHVISQFFLLLILNINLKNCLRFKNWFKHTLLTGRSNLNQNPIFLYDFLLSVTFLLLLFALTLNLVCIIAFDESK